MTYTPSKTAPSEAVQVPRALIILTATVLMALGLFLTGALLKWTLTHKFGSITAIEQSDVTTQMRERQLACLAKNIYHEAGNQPFEGKVAVAQVTINRTNAIGFPNDVCRVIYQKNVFYEKTVCQFSWYCDRETAMKPMNKAVYNECMEVAKKVLLEEFRLPSLVDALYYHADYVNPGWRRQKVAQIGNHIFYR